MPIIETLLIKGGLTAFKLLKAKAISGKISRGVACYASTPIHLCIDNQIHRISNSKNAVSL
jgi:hypothetical protein